MRMPTASPDRRTVPPVLGLTLLLVLGAALGPAGCGKDEGESAAARPQAMVPAAAPTDSGAWAGADSPPAAAEAEPVLAGPLAETPPAPAVAAAAPARQPAGTWSVQAGSFRGQDNAETLVGRIRALGFSPVIETAEPGGVTYYRVIVPGLADRQAAEIVGERLRSELDIRYLIRSSR